MEEKNSSDNIDDRITLDSEDGKNKKSNYEQLSDDMKHPDNWFALSNWAKITNNLTVWERKFAYDIGIQIRYRKPLSDKQVFQAKKIFNEAISLGLKLRPTKPVERKRY
jgi:hypothetical protein